MENRKITRVFTLLALATMACSELLHGQSFYVGIIGGGSFTYGFSERVLGETPPKTVIYPTQRDYLVGPTIEVGLPRRIALGFEALYRPLNQTAATLLADGSLRSISPATVITWELPVLMRYRFTEEKWQPLVEAGPSFRTAGNLNASSPSSKGITLGVGLRTRIGVARVTASFRYTRWASDPLYAIAARTNRNQVVFLLGISFGGSW
jgi:hypothetical protein